MTQQFKTTHFRVNTNFLYFQNFLNKVDIWDHQTGEQEGVGARRLRPHPTFRLNPGSWGPNPYGMAEGETEGRKSKSPTNPETSLLGRLL